jgi:hypothetical protein
MKRYVPGVIGLILATAFAAPSAWADPPPWAPAHGWRAKHAYTYYPRGEVYYARDTGTWFWLDGGHWRSGIRLPDAFQASIRIGGISIELGSDRPYVEHSYVVEHYGGRPPRHSTHERYRDDHDDGDEGPGHGRGHGRHGH